MKMVLGQALWEALLHPKKIKQWHRRIPKEGCNGLPHQFRAITCLNVMYKLLTAIITKILYNHAMAIGAIPQEQWALIRKKRGCTDALLIDSMITQLAKDQWILLSVAWEDYQKAFDWVPHQWIEIHQGPKNNQEVSATHYPHVENHVQCGKGETEIQFELQLKRGISKETRSPRYCFPWQSPQYHMCYSRLELSMWQST